jgi:hypothetical protein
MTKYADGEYIHTTIWFSLYFCLLKRLCDVSPLCLVLSRHCLAGVGGEAQPRLPQTGKTGQENVVPAQHYVTQVPRITQPSTDGRLLTFKFPVLMRGAAHK